MNDRSTVEEARRWVAERADEGAICPCCRQVVKVYPRKINATMALVLIEMAKLVTVRDGPVWQHVQRDVLSKLVARGVHSATSGDYAKLRYWTLISPIPIARAAELGLPSSGIWRLTMRGLLFVQRKVKVQQVARVLGGEVVGFSGPDVSIVDCLGTRFSYDDLVRGSRWHEAAPAVEQWRLL